MQTILLALEPNPLAAPDLPESMGGTGQGYPKADNASAFGFGGQVGIFYDSGSGLKLGASYKTTQSFSEFANHTKLLNSTRSSKQRAEQRKMLREV